MSAFGAAGVFELSGVHINPSSRSRGALPLLADVEVGQWLFV
jgi:hypothetical protein